MCPGLKLCVDNNPDGLEHGHAWISDGHGSMKKILILVSHDQNNSFKISVWSVSNEVSWTQTVCWEIILMDWNMAMYKLMMATAQWKKL